MTTSTEVLPGFRETRNTTDQTEWARAHLHLPDVPGKLIALVCWQDSETLTRAWIARWGDPSRTTSGGGIRMKRGATAQEALYLGSVMNAKFGIVGPDTNGSKIVFDADPTSLAKIEILDRFVRDFLPIFEHMGTAGDLGVSETEVAQVLAHHGIPNPQFGLLKGLGIAHRLNHLNHVMHLPLAKPLSRKHGNLVDVTAGWSIYTATKSYLEARGESVEGKRIALHGVGAVGGSAGVFLEGEGAKIVAVADSDGTLELRGRTSFARILPNIDPVSGCLFRDSQVHQVGDENHLLFRDDIDILVLAAVSDAITGENAGNIRVPLLVEGANHPVTPGADAILAARGIPIVPDFVANAGTAALFTIGMMGKRKVSEQIILEQIKDVIGNAMLHTVDRANQEQRTLRQAALAVASQNLWKEFIL